MALKKTIEIKSFMPRHHTIGAGYGPAKDGEHGAAHGKIILKPGTNAVIYDDWLQVKGLAVIKHYLALGAAEGLVEGETGDKGGELPDRPGDAIRLVGECLDLERLRAWSASTEHRAVKRAIEDQVNKINAARKSGDAAEKTTEK